MAVRRLHICHVITTLGGGGMENGLVNVVNGLDPAHFRSTVVCLHELGPLAERISEPTVTVINLAHRQGLAPDLVFRLARVLRRLRPDIVHTRNYGANFYGTLAGRLIRAPVIINGEHGMVQLVGRRQQQVGRAIALMADHVLCVSPGLRDFLVEKLRYPARKVEVIVNGVDLSRFEARGADTAARRRELGVPADAWLVGSVGRFYPFKDHASILGLLERVPAVDGRPLHACIIGAGAMEDEFRREVTDRGLADRVHLPGFLQDIHAYYPVFDVFMLLSTDNEGTSNVILEAMAAGRPVLATEIPGNRHLIRHGENGILVPPKGPDKLTALVRETEILLADAERRSALARRGYEFVHERLSLSGMIDRYADYYAGAAR
jgi:glycosyltransferase involved in cell wall biosynthesis